MKTNRTVLRLHQMAEKAEKTTLVRTIRGGLLNITPVLIVGAFALILNTFPVEAYQRFIKTFAGGLLSDFFVFVNSATFGVLSIYMTASISRSYMNVKADPRAEKAAPDIGAMMSALLSFFILAGADLPNFSTDSVGPKSMFLAIIAGYGASAMYNELHSRLLSRRRQYYSAGADREFNQMLKTLAPLAITAATFAAFNIFIVKVFNVDSFRMLLVRAFDKLFSFGEMGFFKGFFFVFLSSLLWFFGIHGSDTLESVMQTYFAGGLQANQAAAAAGNPPTEIFTKQFFDCFVLMGGCGSAICLLLAILLFSRNRSRRGLGYAAAFPMIFNINELMVFGLPIIFNPVMLIPFVAVPLVCYSISYGVIAAGIVPMITGGVEWTTPIILGGYQATGSYTGSLLQVFNAMLGVLIYLPFVRMMDRRDQLRYRNEYNSFVDWFRQNEQAMTTVTLIEQKNVYGEFAKALCADLRHGLKSGVVLAYQPQYHYDGRCIGVEALLRWKHPLYGLLYPPLVVKLAEEGGFLPDLEEAVLQYALDDRQNIYRRFGKGIKISVNVTGTTIVTPRYLQFCQRLNAKETFAGMNFGLEVTEQAALSFDEGTISTLRALRDMGLSLSIDDFSMGSTSIHYLKENLFDTIKLDGSLVQGLSTHQNCREIILSITHLASSLGMTVLAEVVETEEDRESLHEIGCDYYQGYLYSPAVFLESESSGRKN